jgi:hypothetical protein
MPRKLGMATSFQGFFRPRGGAQQREWRVGFVSDYFAFGGWRRERRNLECRDLSDALDLGRHDGKMEFVTLVSVTNAKRRRGDALQISPSNRFDRFVI